MRINSHITMPRKMFGTCHYANILHSFHILNSIQGHFIFVFTKTTVVNYRVIGIVIYIHHRCIINLYA